MANETITDFLIGIGVKVDAPGLKQASAAATKMEADITAGQAAEIEKRIAAETAASDKRIAAARKEKSTKVALLQELGEIAGILEEMRHDQAVKLEEDRAEKAEAIRKAESESANKRDAEDLKKATARRDALLKSTRALALGITGAITGLAAGVTGAATGLLWATDRAAKHFERLAYAGQNSGSSARGLSRFAYQASQLGDTAEGAQASVAAFGENLKKLPALEGMLKGMGIATRDMSGNLRDSSEVMAEYIGHLRDLPQLQREARASAWGISDATTRAVLRPGFAGLGTEYDRIQGTVGADPNAASQGAIGFEQAMRRGFEIIGAVKTRVETSLFDLIKPRLDDVSKWVLDHGEAISNVVTSISKGLTDLATAFVKSDVVQGALSGLGDGLERLAKYVGSDDFKKDVAGFVDDVKAMARAIRSALEWIGVLPSRSGSAVVPDPVGSAGNPGGGQPADPYMRGMHGRHPSDLTPEQVQRAQEKFHAFGGEGGTRSWRNNNPGNISAGKFATAHGADGSDGRFAHFPTYEAGRKAQEELWFNSDLYKGKTLASAVEQWSPRSENDTDSIIKNYAAAVGIDPSTPLSQFTPAQRAKLLDAQQAREGWREGTRQNGVKAPSESVAVAGDSPEVAEARRYLSQTATGAAAQRADSIVKLNPAFALAAAKTIRQARAEGINAGIGSGYRSFGQTGSAYDAQGYSGHSYGLASDFSGIGTPGSAQSRRFDEIAQSMGLGGYGADNPREWNHKELGSHLQHDRDRLARMRATLGPNGEMVDPHATWAASGYVLPPGSKPAGEAFPQVAKPAPPPLAARTFGTYLRDSGAPVKVAVTDDSAFKLGKAFVSSSPLLQMPHGSGPNTMAAFHSSWLKYSQENGKDLVHPGEKHSAFKAPPLGMTPSLYAAYDNSHRRGDTNINHSPTFNIHGGDTKSSMDHARLVASRGTADLVRNMRAVEQ